MNSQKSRRMRPQYLTLGLTVMLAIGACSQGDRATGAPASARAAPAAGQIPARTPAAGRFAGMADRGTLLQQDGVRRTYTASGHQWQPVTFSEAHALAAVSSGQLLVTLPDGRPLPLRYSRHVEHPDGNWTFVGKGPQGEDAVITFGPDAVFGSIQTRGGSVRLTTDARGGWMVFSGPGAASNQIRPGSDDAWLPPERLTRDGGRPRLAGDRQAAAGKVEAQVADASTVVDVVVGFTSGLASALGSESAARTRVNNLVEITNQAYANSGIAARVRLAHAMPVEFPDATDNGDALSKLSGYKSGSGAVPVDPSLQALRTARDQYNGDLVVLLRDFQTPENNGCGIAWLIGGKLSVVDQGDESFGYSVVADGSDLDETDSKTYFCREETFAHELGHLMGQTHSSEDSTSPGAHPYSYGYRQTFATGFYTVMAYRLKDSSQTSIRHFSNPNINYNGAPTGTADADNTRSLLQTMPVIANFRLGPPASSPTVAPPLVARRVPYDVNGDGRSDVFLRGDTALAFWAMNGTTRTFDSFLGNGGAGWRVVAFGDFDAAAGADVLWANGSQMKIWFNMGGGSYVVYQMGSYGNGFEPFAAADVNGDGKSDILLRNGTAIAYWLLDGATVISSAYAGDGGAGFRVVTTGDFTGDGADEIVWASATQVKMWVNGRSAGYSPVIVGSYGNGYAPFAAGYVDGDSSLDLLFRSGTAIAYWRLNGSTRVSDAYLGDGGAGYVPFAVGDYDGNGTSDIGWQNGKTIKFWMNNGAGAYTSGILGNYVCCYAPIGNF